MFRFYRAPKCRSRHRATSTCGLRACPHGVQSPTSPTLNADRKCPRSSAPRRRTPSRDTPPTWDSNPPARFQAVPLRETASISSATRRCTPRKREGAPVESKPCWATVATGTLRLGTFQVQRLHPVIVNSMRFVVFLNFFWGGVEIRLHTPNNPPAPRGAGGI